MKTERWPNGIDPYRGKFEIEPAPPRAPRWQIVDAPAETPGGVGMLHMWRRRKFIWFWLPWVRVCSKAYHDGPGRKAEVLEHLKIVARGLHRAGVIWTDADE